MRRIDSSTSTNVDDEVEDISYTARELKFAAILDISLFSRAMNSLILYFSKVNGSMGVPLIVGAFFACLSLIQIILPSILINSDLLWPDDHILTEMFKIFAVFYDGPHETDNDRRVSMSLLLAIIYFVTVLLVLIRSFIFATDKVISKAESFLCQLMFRYIFMFFCPHLLSGFPLACHHLRTKAIHALYDIIAVILIPISTIIFVFFYYFFMQTRVLLENSQCHEWLPLFPFREFSTFFCSMLASCVGYISGNFVLIFPLVIAVIYMVSGIYIFIYSSYIKQSFGLLFASAELTASIISIIQVANIITKKISQVFVLVAIFLVFIIVYFIFAQIHRQRVFSMLRLCDECLQFPERSTSLLDKEFKSSTHFLYKVIPMIDQWHPFIVTWKIFDYAISRWPKNFYILLLYGRLISLFPPMNTTMLWISSLVSKFHNPLSHTYCIQFRQISQTRQKAPSYQLRKKMDDLKSRMDLLLALMRRFWENILQKNTTNFWDDVDKVTRRIKELESALIQLTEDFPNNVDVFYLYHQFASQIKHSFVVARETGSKISQIERHGYQKQDTAMQLALILFPSIEPYLHDFQDHSSNTNTNTNSNTNTNAMNTMNAMSLMNNSYQNMNMNSASNQNSSYIDLNAKQDENKEFYEDENAKSEQSSSENMAQFELAMQELTEHTKLGRVWQSLLVCVVMSGIVIGVFFVFRNIYINGFIEKQEKNISFMAAFGSLRYKIAYLDLMVNLQTLFISKKITLSESTMHRVAPNLYTKCHELPMWQFSVQLIKTLITQVSKETAEMLSALFQLDGNQKSSKDIRNSIVYTEIYDSMTFESTMNQMFQDCEEILDNTHLDDYMYSEQYSRLSPIFQLIHPFLENISNNVLNYALDEYNMSKDMMDILLVVVIVLALVLVTIPFIFQLFKLQTENSAISDSFAFFPNTEIRDIINKFGMSSAKREDDATYIAQVTQTSNNRHHSGYLKLLFTFFATFFPLTICCLVMHFIESNFINDSRATSIKIWTLYEPFADLYLSLKSSVSVAISDILDFGTMKRDLYALEIGRTTSKAEDVLATGMWGKFATINIYFKYVDTAMNFYPTCFPNDTVPQTKSLFEVLVTNDFPASIDLACGAMKSLSIRLLNGEMDISDSELLSLYYYFTDFLENQRNTLYFDKVEEVTRSAITAYRDTQDIITALVVICQCLACIFLVFILISKHTEIKNSLRFFHDLSPLAVMQNQHAMLLLDSGRIQNERHKSSFSNAEAILAKIPHGIVLIDRQLVVTDINQAFLRIIKFNNNNDSNIVNNNIYVNTNVNLNESNNNHSINNINNNHNVNKNHINHINNINNINDDDDNDNDDNDNDDNDNDDNDNDDNDNDDDEAIARRPITDIIHRAEEDDRSWPDFVQKMSEAFIGRQPTQFGSNVTVRLCDGSIAHFLCNVICLAADRPAVDGEHESIEKIAILINDCTEEISKRSKIENEQKKITSMISNVVPPQIATELIGGEDNISFVSQSVTIGEIEISYNRTFDYDSTDVFSFLFKLSSEIDKIIADFDLICKVRSCGDRFVFAGGLFNRVSKPDRHADQAVRFSLKVIERMLSLANEIKTELAVRVGIHTGGPVVAGIMSLTRPTFQIIGPVMDTASQLISSCVQNQVHVSRSVYELIFSSGFRVHEKGDTMIRGGNVIQTYLITLQ